jgi:cytochrome b561
MATPEKFSKIQIYLHWLIALMVIFQIVLHDDIVTLWAQRMDGIIPNEAVPTPHSIVGILIFVLMAWRLIIRLRRGIPALPPSETPILGLIAKGTHFLFYALLLIMPISGAVAWFFGIEQAANAHALAKFILIPLILLHFSAAMAHHFVLKTNVLKQILGMK